MGKQFGEIALDGKKHEPIGFDNDWSKMTTTNQDLEKSCYKDGQPSRVPRCPVKPVQVYMGSDKTAFITSVQASFTDIPSS